MSVINIFKTRQLYFTSACMVLVWFFVAFYIALSIIDDRNDTSAFGISLGSFETLLNSWDSNEDSAAEFDERTKRDLNNRIRFESMKEDNRYEPQQMENNQPIIFPNKKLKR